MAGFPATAPRDVIGEAPVGVLDEDLQLACLGALDCSRADCRDFALNLSWAASALARVIHGVSSSSATIGERVPRANRSIAFKSRCGTADTRRRCPSSARRTIFDMKGR